MHFCDLLQACDLMQCTPQMWRGITGCCPTAVNRFHKWVLARKHLRRYIYVSMCVYMDRDMHEYDSLNHLLRAFMIMGPEELGSQHDMDIMVIGSRWFRELLLRTASQVMAISRKESTRTNQDTWLWV